MELLQLQYFVEIARQESVKEASKRLFVSQPSLSQSVRRLETELGVSLFRHEGRNIRLTEQGRRFFLRAEQALRTLESARSELDGKELQGRVRLGTYMPIRPLLSCLKQYTENYRYVTFDITMVSSALSGFDPGTLDLLMYYEQSNHLDFHEHIEIGETERRWVVPKNHPLAGRSSLGMNEMEQEAFVSMVWGDGRQEELFQEYAHAGISPQIRYRTNSIRIKQELLGAGMAVGSGNDLVIGKSQENFVVIRQEDRPRERLYLGWRAECYLSPAALSFVRFCREWFAEPAHQYCGG